MPTALISYSHEDADAAAFLAGTLKEHGVTVWLDHEQLRVGQGILARISDALEGADYCVVLMSQHARKSEWVQTELGIAAQMELERRRPIVLPVRIDGTSFPALVHKKYVDFSDRALWPQAARDLIHAMAGTSSTPSALAVLHVPISGWFHPDPMAFARNVFALAPEGRIAQGFRVEVQAPQYEALRQHVLDQSRRAKTPGVLREQLGALAQAAAKMSALQTWSTKLLQEVAGPYGLQAATGSCMSFIRYMMGPLVQDLAHFQLAGDAIYDTFNEQLNGGSVELAQYMFDCSRVLKVTIASSTSAYFREEHVTAYFPPNRVRNAQSSMFAGLWDTASLLDTDLWLEHAIPQIARENCLGISACCPWRREDAWFISDGTVWDGKRCETFGPAEEIN